MLVTNYGIDCAFAQILYYHEKGEMNFTTVSPRNINTFLVSTTPDILLGFSNIGVPISSKTKIIDNTKTALNFFEEFPNFYYREKTSRTRILYELLQSKNKDLIKYCNIADEITKFQSSDEIDMIKDLYEVIGHDQFVYRFIVNPDLTLNKNEEQLVLRNRKHKEFIAKEYIKDFVTYDDGIAVCKSFFNLNDVIENNIISKYEEVAIIATWDYTQDGDIKINLSSRSDAAGKIAQYFNGFGFLHKGSYKIEMIQEDEDINLYILEQIKNARVAVYEVDLTNRYDQIQAEIEEDPIITLFRGVL